jgi:hypothetical protein
VVEVPHALTTVLTVLGTWRRQRLAVVAHVVSVESLIQVHQLGLHRGVDKARVTEGDCEEQGKTEDG